MLRPARWKVLVIAVALLGASALTGNTTEQHYLKLKKGASIEGVLLKPGTYTVQVESQESQATVRFIRENKIVATVHGQIKEAAGVSLQDVVFYTKDADGTDIITKLRLRGTTRSIVFPVIRTMQRSTVNAFPDQSDSINRRMLGRHGLGRRTHP